MFNTSYPNLESKINYSTQELSKLLDPNNKDVAFARTTYADIRTILDKATGS
jgi:hypothetical protein